MNNELDERISRLRRQADEAETKTERNRSVSFRYMASVFVILILIIGHLFIRSFYSSVAYAEVRDSLAIVLNENDSLVANFNATLDSIRGSRSYAQKHNYNSIPKSAHGTIESPTKKNYIKEKNRPIEKININTADTTSLKKLTEIGSARAKGIVKYREILGGYYSTKQLYEVYCMDSSAITKNLCYLECDASMVKKIDINHTDPKTLYHPYLKYEKDYSLLNAIRKKLYDGHTFSSFADIESMQEYDAKKHSQARYYLIFK